jgi:ubiquinone/menaquinone biosynthesis C-methylase UbiE/uncharacterized protein YbaR (Trm112 family)
MKQDLLSILICPKCKLPLNLLAKKKLKNRVQDGKLFCDKCNVSFEIIDEIVCFKPLAKKDKSEKQIRKIRDLFIEQEVEKKWMKHFAKQEIPSLKSEWSWMIDALNVRKSKIHLDWATGTGRFLRNILNIIDGEVIVLEVDYPTCVGLKTFLKKINKYSKVTIMCGDAKNIPLASSSVDSISSWHGLDEPKISKAIGESKRILKPNKILSMAGLFYESGSKSSGLAQKYGIEFAEENKIQRYFRKLRFKNICYKNFFHGKWLDHNSFLPRFGDYYTSYAISGKK